MKQGHEGYCTHQLVELVRQVELGCKQKVR